MSLTFTLTGKSSILAVLSSHRFERWPYELGLTDFEIYYTILSVNSSNNKFYFDKDDKKIVAPEESYKLHDIDKYLKRAISNDITKKKTLRKDEDNESEYSLIIRANNNTIKSEIKCVYQINFIKSHNIAVRIFIETYTRTATMAFRWGR